MGGNGSLVRDRARKYESDAIGFRTSWSLLFFFRGIGFGVGSRQGYGVFGLVDDVQGEFGVQGKFVGIVLEEVFGIVVLEQYGGQASSG